MNNNEYKLQQILSEVERKTVKKLTRNLISFAIREDISLKEIELNHNDFYQKYKRKIRTEFLSEYSETIAKLEALIKEEKEAEEKLLKEKAEAEAKAKEKLPKDINLIIKRKRRGTIQHQEELDYIEDKYFNQNYSYRLIAFLIEREEKSVRKIVSKMLAKKLS